MAAQSETSGSGFESPASVYDGFISYSHGADDLLAPRLQAGLQRFAKPWWKRRALRMFRDEASLSANPHLWSSITDALDGSDWFVLLLSEEAAQSEWVNREVEYWLEHKDASRIVPVVTDGEFGWDTGDVSVSSTAAPPALSGVFVEEPRWVDLRWARSEEQLDLNNARFRDGIADIASAIRQVPKDELESEEVRQHRRTIRTAWAAGIVVLVLGVVAAIGAVIAVGQSNEAQQQRDEAERQTQIAQSERATAQAERDRADQLAKDEAAARAEAEASEAEAQRQARTAQSEALAANAQAVLDEDPELSVLLAAQALELEPRPAALAAMHTAIQEHRTIFQAKPPTRGLGPAAGGMSPNGKLLAVFGMFGTEMDVWDVDSGERVWGVSTNEPIVMIDAAFTVEGDQLLLYVGDQQEIVEFEIRVFDAKSGALARIIEVPDCSGWKYYPNVGRPFVDLSRPFVWTVDDDCDQFGTPDGQLGFLDPNTGAFTPVRSIRAFNNSIVGYPTQDAARRLLALDDPEGIDGLVIDVDTGETVFSYPGGMATLTADGQRLLAGGDADSPLELWDITTGERLWRFGTDSDVFMRAWFSSDESLVYATRFAGSTFLIDAESGLEVMRLSGHTGFQTKVVMSDDQTRLATFSQDGTARVWDIGRVVASEGPTYAINSGTMQRRSGSADVAGGVAAIWAGQPFSEMNADWETVVIDLETGATLLTVSGGSSALSPDGTLLAYRVLDEVTLTAEQLRGRAEPGRHRRVGDIRIVDIGTGEVVTEIEAPCHAYLAGGDTVPGAGCEGAEGRAVWTRNWDMEFSVDGRLLAVADGADATLRVIDVASGDIVFTDTAHDPRFNRKAQVVRFSPDARYLVVGFDGPTALSRVYELETFSLVAELDFRAAGVLDFTRDGAMAVTGNFGGALTYVGTSDWSIITQVEAHQGGGVHDVNINPSGTLVVSVGADAVRIWDLSDGSLVAEITLPLISVSDVTFLDDTHVLVVPAFASVAVVINLDPKELAEIGNSLVTRAFTEEECATYLIDPCPTTLEALRSG